MNQAKQTITTSEESHPEASGYPEGSPERDFVHAIVTAQENLVRAQRDRGRS